MKRLQQNQRVIVSRVLCHTNEHDIAPTVGTVVRLRIADDGAFVRLDKRLGEDVHMFPASDKTRRTSVLTYPEWCEPRPVGEGVGE